MKRLTDNISLRADARYRIDGNATNAFNANNFGDTVLSVGLNIALGQKAQLALLAPAAPAEPALKTQRGQQLEQAKSGARWSCLKG